MKLRSHLKDRIILAILSYFGYKPENIRQAQIVPGRYYDNFGFVVKAVPISRQEQLERQTIVCSIVEHQSADTLHSPEVESRIEFFTSGCDTCPFSGVKPCPINLLLPDGSKVCHSHKFIVIKNNSLPYV